jgi:hypothetical protein
MTRRNISLNFRRRILATISSLFQRRRVAPVRSTRRSRWSQRIREFSEQVRTATAASTKLVNSHLLTLGAPEFLEQRKVMAVQTLTPLGSSATELLVWMDQDNDHALVTQTNARLEIRDGSLMTSPIVYNGAAPQVIRFFDASNAGLTNNLTVSNAGAGYTRLQNLTISDTSLVNQVQGFVGLSLTNLSISTSSGFTTGSGNGVATINLRDAGNFGLATASVSLVNGAINTAAGFTILSSNGTFRDLTTLTITEQGGAGTGTGNGNGTLGSITYLNHTEAGVANAQQYDRLYFATPTITLSGPGGGTSGAVAVSAAGATAATAFDAKNTQVTVGQIGGPVFTPTLLIGAEQNASAASLGDIEVFTLGTPASGGITVNLADSIQIDAAINSSTNGVFLSIGNSTADTLSIGANVTAPSIFFNSLSGGTITSTGASVRATTGAVRFNSTASGGLTIASDLTATGGIDLASQAGDLTTKGSLNATGGTVLLNAAAGSVFSNSASINAGGSLTVLAGAGSAWLSGSTVKTGTGGVLMRASAETHVEATVTSDGNVDIRNPHTVFINGTVTGSSEVLLQSYNRAIAITGSVSADASSGDVLLYATDPTNGTVTGLPNLTGRGLTIYTGTNAPISIVSNVTQVTSKVPGNLTITNARSLIIDTALASGGSEVVIATTGAGSNLTIAGSPNLTGASTNLTLSASGRLTASANIDVPGNISLISTAGCITIPTSAVLARGGRLDAIAETGILLGNSVTASTLNLATNTGGILVQTQPAAGGTNVTFANAVANSGDVSIAATTGNLVVTDRVGSVTGNLSIRSFVNSVVLSSSANLTAPAGTASVIAATSVVADANASLNAATLNYSAQSTSSLLTDPDVAYRNLRAQITGSGNPLNVSTAGALNVTGINTVNGDADITVTDGDLTINGAVSVGTGKLTLSTPAGGINATGSINATTLNSSSQNSGTFSNAVVSNVVASVTGSGQNFTLTSPQAFAVGADNITASGGTISLTALAGNLSRTGEIRSVGGAVALNVGSNFITGTGGINTNAFSWIANIAPSETNLVYSELTANQTGGGNLTINHSVAGGLKINSIATKSGAIALNVSGGNITIAGPIASAGAPANVTLKATAGTINQTAGVITANVLDVTALNDTTLATNVATLTANVSGGSFSVVEANDLTIGTGSVSAATNVSITLTSGSLTRTGSIGAAQNLILSVANGTIDGTGSISADNFFWTSKNSPSAFITANGISANLTAPGPLVIQSAGDLKILGAVSQNGDIQILPGFSNTVTFLGSVTAGGNSNVLISAGNAIASTPAALITGNVLNITADSNATLFTNVAAIEGTINNGFLDVTETNDLTITANGVSTPLGNTTITLTNGNLSGSGNVTADERISLSAANGSIALNAVGQLLTADTLVLTAQNNAFVRTNVDEIMATVSAGGLDVSQAAKAIDVLGVTANGSVSLTVGTGTITGSGALNAGVGDVVLSAAAGDIAYSGSLISGNVLTATASGNIALNTNVNTLVANAAGGTLDVLEQNGFAIGAANVVAFGDIDINLAAGSLTGTGGITSVNLGDITINASLGGVSPSGTIAGDRLTITANDAVTVNTAINAVAISVDNEAQGIVINQSGDLTIDGADISTANGSITIIASGNISRSGEINAGTADVTLNATRGIIGTGLITGDLLDVVANSTSALNTAVNSLAVNLSGAGQSLTVFEDDGLAIAAAGVRTNNGFITIQGGVGDLTGSGVVSAGTGNVTLSFGGEINLASTSQITGNVLTLTADGLIDVGTNVTAVDATITDPTATFTLAQAQSLRIDGITTDQGNVDINITAGSITGEGVIDAALADVTLIAAAGSINLASAGFIQIDRALELTLRAQNDSAANISAEDLVATVTNGNLVIVEEDAINAVQGGINVSGNLTLTAGGNLGGSADVVAGNVTLDVDGDVTLNAVIGQLQAATLNVTATGDVNVNTTVTSLLGSVAGDLTVSETGDLNIGLSASDEIRVDGDVDVELPNGGTLAGLGIINATGNVTLVLGNDGGIDLDSQTAQVRGDTLTVSGTNGSIAINTAVNNLAASLDLGSITITENNGLVVDDITAVDGPIAVTVSSGDLEIDSGSITAAPSRNVSLTATVGAIVSQNYADAGNFGMVYGNVLTLSARNASSINTSVSTLVANVTGAGQDLTIYEQEGNYVFNGALVPPNGLTIGTGNVVANGGDISIFLLDDPANGVVGGNLTGAGLITTSGDVNLVVPNGSITLNTVSGQISAALLNVAVRDSSFINTNVTDLAANVVNGTLTVVEQTSLGIDAADVVASGDISLTLVNGNLAGPGNILSSNGSVNLAAAAGNIVLDDQASQVQGNLLTIRAQNTSSVNTAINSVTANVTVGGLTIVESSGLSINASDVTANGAVDISLTAGNLSGPGNIVSTSSNVTLNASAGNVTLTDRAGQVRAAGTLDLTAQNASSVNTNVTTLVANVTTGGLTVLETNGLIIGNDVLANGNINITLTDGNITGVGLINATGGQNVTLNASNGSITLSGVDQVTGNVLDLVARDTSIVGTNVTTLVANVTSGDLTINESTSLNIGSNNVRATNVTLNVADDLFGPGNIVATTNVTLLANNITLTDRAGQVQAGGTLNLTTTGTAAINTNVATLVGTTDKLTVVEANALTIGQNLVASNDVSITTGGALSLDGQINAGVNNVTLNVTGGISGSGLVTADTLNVTATATSAINTAVDTLVANITSGDLTVFESNGIDVALVNVAAGSLTLQLAAGDVISSGNISAANDITLNAVTGNVTVDNFVVAGGNVSLLAAAGTVTADTLASQVQGNLLTIRAQNSSSVNTSVTSLVANITDPSATLTVVEATALTIGSAGVRTAGGDIDLTTGGSLTRTGAINAVGGNVTLNVTGGITGTGLVTGNVLTVDATQASSINTAINSVVANITGRFAPLSIYETNGLVVSGASIETNDGAVLLDVATGNLLVTDDLDAGTGAVTLNVPNGSINATGTILGGALDIRANSTSTLNTAVTSLVANVTGLGQTLTVREQADLGIVGLGVRTNNALIDLTLVDGSLNIGGPINAIGGDVALNVSQGGISGTGLVTGNALAVQASRTSSLTTSVNSVTGTLTGASQTLTISEANGLAIGAANLVASGSAAQIVVNVSTGNLTGTGSIRANNGVSAITLTTLNGDINMAGLVDAGTTGRASLAANGSINLPAAEQVTARTLRSLSAGNTTVGTNIAELSAVVTGSGSTLTVVDRDGFTVLSNTAITNNGNISLTAGNTAVGDLVINGSVNAGNRNVTLTNNNGGIRFNGNGLVSGASLSVTSLNAVNLATNVAVLTANVTGSGQTLRIRESNDLSIGAANVVTNGGAINVTLTTGNLTGVGNVNAGSGNVTLGAIAGNVTLSGVNQVTGDVLNVTARDSSVVRTNVNGVTGVLTGPAASLTVTEASDLRIDGITTANGAVSLTTLAGNITGSGGVTTGTADVSLNAAAAINTTGNLTANVVRLRAGGDANVTTNANNLTANLPAGSLTVLEQNGLVVDPTGIRASGNASITLLAGNLTGTGTVVAGNIALNAITGGITLNSSAGQVRAPAGLLDVRAATGANLATNVATLSGVLNGSLTVTEVNALEIDAAGINTNSAGGNGNVSISLPGRGASLTVTGDIDAGSGNITLSVPSGNVTGAGLIAGNVLSLTARTGADISTALNTLDAVITSTGHLIVEEADNLTVNRAITTSGNVNITSLGMEPANGTLTIRTLTAGRGAVNLTAVDVVLNGSITAGTNINLAGVSNSVQVINGTITPGRSGTVETGGRRVNWLVDNTGADSGVGSLRSALSGANAFKGPSAIGLADVTVNVTSAPLPTVTGNIAITGNGNVTLNGSALSGASAVGLTISGNNSSLSNVTLANFAATGLSLVGGRSTPVDIDVSNVTITGSRLGLSASGQFKTSTWQDLTINAGTPSAGTIGVLLSGATGPALNAVTLSNSNVTNYQTGISAARTLARTRIQSVTVSNSSLYGLSLAAATGLSVSGLQVNNMTSNASGTAGIYATGFCTGSTITGTSFGAFFANKNLDVTRARNLVIN